MNSRQSIRRNIREQRRQLSHLQRQQAAIGVFDRLRSQAIYRAAKRVAVYLENDGEMPMGIVTEDLWRRKTKCFLPVIFGYENNKMHFARYRPDSKLLSNRYGILEPEMAIRRQIKAHVLDLVLLPLVAFDRQGNRLGMGGGYYDRSFSFLRRRVKWKKPKLIGVAYDFQEVPSIDAQNWDVPLDAIVTESRFIKIKRS